MEVASFLLRVKITSCELHELLLPLRLEYHGVGECFSISTELDICPETK